MNKLSKEKRALILSALVEGNSMRSTARLCDVSRTTVGRLLDLAGAACKKHHDKHVRGVKGVRDVQCDELWSFIYAKKKNVGNAVAVPPKAGDVWTWTALDTDSRLLLTCMVRKKRNAASAVAVMKDLQKRLNKRPRLSSDSLRAYKIAAHRVFGKKVKLVQLRKGEDLEEIEHHTSYVERYNLTIRMTNRRFTRKTNGFSKSVERHVAMLNLLTVHYNFCRIHQTLRVTPAMEAGIDSKLRDFDWLVDLVDKHTPKPRKSGPKKGTKYRPRNSVKST